jgi:hypothetical protein
MAATLAGDASALAGAKSAVRTSANAPTLRTGRISSLVGRSAGELKRRSAFTRDAHGEPFAPELHGPAGACSIDDPGEAGLAEMLAQRVGTSVARQRS